MGKQIGFFMNEQDEREFSEFALKSSDIVFVPRVNDTMTLPEFRHLDEANKLKKSLFLLFTRLHLLDNHPRD
jgi:hypothetical protein